MQPERANSDHIHSSPSRPSPAPHGPTLLFAPCFFACAGVSLKTQELSALYLGIRLTCSLALEMDMHTLLDGLAFLSTVAIILSIRFTKLRETYQKNLDNMNTLYIGVPCVLLALVAHPMNYHWIGYRVMWALSIFLEVVAVLPQLRMMQNAQMVEKLTAHYVFSLGVSRFLNCAHWTLLLLEGSLHSVTSQGTIWGWTALFAEIAQSSILADFCYYYLKAHTNGGNGIMRLPRLSRVV